MDNGMLNSIDWDTCIALIPARGGSKSVPKKNIRMFRGHPLIAYSIAAAHLSKNIDRVIVSTDSEEIAGIARSYGAEVPFLRPAEYAQDHSTDIEFVKHALGWFYKNERKIPAHLVHLRPTSPVRDFRIIDEAIQMVLRDPAATSLRSGYLCVSPPFKWFQFEGDYVKPLMPGITCDEANLPRQDFPRVLVPNGYVDVLNSEFVIRNELLHGDRMIGFLTEKVPDIDTEADLYGLEIYKEQKEAFEELKDYLDTFM